MAMDPNPKKFPILSYVLKSETDSDLLPLPTEQLMEKMPNLMDPKVLASMTRAVSDVAQTRSVLQTLGGRPDHEAVDVARAKIVEVGSSLSKQLERIVLGPRPENVDRLKWRAQQAVKEKGCRLAAEKERRIYKAVVELDELHNAYEKLLRAAEERLEKIYGSTEMVPVSEERGESSSRLWEVNDEVVEILQDATGKGLESVELPRRQLRFLPEAFGKLCGLLVLNLSGNLLEVIPDSIAGLEKLQELYLSSNLLESLPDSIGLLQNLKILDVSGNKLTSLPDSISHCRLLVELDTSFNSLTYLPTNIGYELVNLQRLSIHLNKIRSLPSSISEMRSLRYLDAHFNELLCLPHSIGKLTNLENLNISSNFSDLTELPDTIGDLINLRELDLSHNQIRSLPDTFGRINSLTKLNLDQNPLIIPPMEVVDKGVEAVKVFMAKRWLDILLEEERRRMFEAQTGWLNRSTSWFSNWVSGSVAGFLGAGGKSPKDPFLDQQL